MLISNETQIIKEITVLSFHYILIVPLYMNSTSAAQLHPMVEMFDDAES